MKTYDIWASLWNFELSPSQKAVKIGDFEIIEKERQNFSNDFWGKVVNIGLPESDTRLLLTLAHLYTAQQSRDFPPYIIKTKLEFEDAFDFSRADKKIKSFILALRLYKEGDVIGRFLAGTPSEEKYSQSLFFDTNNFQGIENKYTLDSVSKFKDFLEKFGEVDNLIDSVPLDRFSLAYSHYQSPVEKLIDLVIVLESLFNKSPSDVKFKIALRAAHLLGNSDHGDIHSIYKEIKSIYELRNSIVHGHKLKEEEIANVKEANRVLNPIIRTILLKSINLRQSGKLDLFENDDESEIDNILLNTQLLDKKWPKRS